MNDKTILVTGGTGSFAHKFIEMLLNLSPRKVIIFSRDEFKQNIMAQRFTDKRLRFFIGDVRDKDRLYRAMQGVDYVVHAAAMKQIPICEHDPSEAVKTNVFGAQNVIEAAINAGVEKVVALSTDKAVSPINLYGACKLCSDKLFTAANAYSHRTRFAVVRYGNVVGSRGSVIPLFKEQAKTGTLTITDKRMTRFWITLEQAVQLVLRAFQDMQGGEIFVPKIPSMRIVDLAKAIAPECKITFVGIRPGEKLHEAMITKDDARRTIEYEGYYIIQPDIANDDRFNWGFKLEKSNMREGFEYASDKNSEWLTVEELQTLI